MSQEPTTANAEPEIDSTQHIVHVLMQFALAVRHRRNVLIVAVVVACLLGGLYYFTATRYYQSRAALVLQIGSDALSPGMATQESWQLQGLLPTYQHLIDRTKVIEGAIKKLRPEDRIDFAQKPKNKWIDSIRSHLSVKNQRGTSIVEVSYTSEDPRAAASVVNAILDSYVDFMDEHYRGTARELIDMLTTEQRELEGKLSTNEKELLRLGQESNSYGISAESKVLHPLVQKAVTLNEQWVQTRLTFLDLRSSEIAILAAVRNGDDLQQHILGLADVVGREVLLSRLGLSSADATLLGNLEQELIEDKAKLTDLEKVFLPAHPDITFLQRKIASNEEFLMGYQDRVQQRASRVRDSQLGPMMIDMVQQKLNQTGELEASLRDELDNAEREAWELSGQLVRVETLRRERSYLHNMKDVLLDRIANVEMQNAGQEIRATIVDPATMDNAPVSPGLAKTALLTLFLGFAAGLAFIYVLDILDDRFRSLEEMQALLRTPVLAMIKELDASNATGVEALQTYVSPNASESEAFRTLRTALSFAEQETHQIVISSPEPGDGKTTVLANLAVAVAQSGKKTLLIDADLRRPGLTAMMGMRGIEGLSSVIRGNDDLVGMATTHIRASGLEGLDVLAAGPRPTNPAELLGSQRFSELLAWAESVYDQILIDSPPSLAASDTAVIGRLVSGVVLVVQPAKNRRRAVMRCVDCLTMLKIPLLGLVVNRIGAEKEGGYYGYGYGGYYGYGYSYHSDEDNSEDQPASDQLVGIQEALSVQINENLPPDEAHSSAGIIPRRVA